MANIRAAQPSANGPAAQLTNYNKNQEASHLTEIQQNQESEMSEGQVEFSVFCIENVASKLGLSGDEAYLLLTGEHEILDEYIIPNYEILHTQSKEYIVNDIVDYMKECGVLESEEV